MHHVTGITEDAATGSLWAVGFNMENIPESPNPTKPPFYYPVLAKIPYGDNDAQLMALLGSYDLGLPMSIVWTGTNNACYTGLYFDKWLAVGSPECWCTNVNPRQCHGDADGQSQGKQQYWVSTNDLDILIAAWNKPFEQIEGVTKKGIPLICSDFDHLPKGKNDYHVSVNDLDILIANWNTANKPDPNCP
jgi:hypothetical protein